MPALQEAAQVWGRQGRGEQAAQGAQEGQQAPGSWPVPDHHPRSCGQRSTALQVCANAPAWQLLCSVDVTVHTSHALSSWQAQGSAPSRACNAAARQATSVLAFRLECTHAHVPEQLRACRDSRPAPPPPSRPEPRERDRDDRGRPPPGPPPGRDAGRDRPRERCGCGLP